MVKEIFRLRAFFPRLYKNGLTYVYYILDTGENYGEIHRLFNLDHDLPQAVQFGR